MTQYPTTADAFYVALAALAVQNNLSERQLDAACRYAERMGRADYAGVKTIATLLRDVIRAGLEEPPEYEPKPTTRYGLES